MNIKNKLRKPLLNRMTIRLWLIMMSLVGFTIILMWTIQIFILEKNYTGMIINQIQENLKPVMSELMTEDLACNENLIPYLSQTAKGKMMLVDENGKLMEMYSYGHSINLKGNTKDITVWENIENSDVYSLILNRQTYHREIKKRSKRIAYEIGIPTWYHEEPTFVILYRSFSELYDVLDINRMLLIIFSMLLTLISAVIAAVLSKRFIKPIDIMKKSIDELAAGNLKAAPNIVLKDEMGQLAESVKKLGQALQRVDSLRKEVIANVSHELRSPLSLIGGYAELVRDIHWKDKEKREEDLNLIIKESQRMSEMVRDILDYSQLQAGYLQLHKDWYNLCEILESEVLFCEQSAAEHQIQIETIFSQKEIIVYLDALKISQVIRNLLYNAINHTKDGLSIIIDITGNAFECRVSIKNVGDPIPEQERELIWERYQRSQHQGGRKEGTGLGLSIVSTILKEHKMKYGVDYQEGRNIFWFQYEKEKEFDETLL